MKPMTVGLWTAERIGPGRDFWEIKSPCGRMLVTRRAMVDLRKLLAKLVADKKLAESGRVPLLSRERRKSGNLLTDASDRLVYRAARQWGKIDIGTMSLTRMHVHIVVLGGEPLDECFVRAVGLDDHFDAYEMGFALHSSSRLRNHSRQTLYSAAIYG